MLLPIHSSLLSIMFSPYGFKVTFECLKKSSPLSFGNLIKLLSRSYVFMERLVPFMFATSFSLLEIRPFSSSCFVVAFRRRISLPHFIVTFQRRVSSSHFIVAFHHRISSSRFIVAFHRSISSSHLIVAFPIRSLFLSG